MFHSRTVYILALCNLHTNICLEHVMKHKKSDEARYRIKIFVSWFCGQKIGDGTIKSYRAYKDAIGIFGRKKQEPSPKVRLRCSYDSHHTAPAWRRKDLLPRNPVQFCEWMDWESGSVVGVKLAGLLDRTDLAAVDILNLRLQLIQTKTPHTGPYVNTS
jgi:hypothetical protein